MFSKWVNANSSALLLSNHMTVEKLLRSTVLSAAWVLIAILLPVACAESSGNPPSYKTSPVFFERFYANYADAENASLLRDGRVRLTPLGTESVEGFDWITHRRQDKSWWQRIENFIYLLPTIMSEDPVDRQLARDWLFRWYHVHQANAKPNEGAWDGMTAGMRVMVFVFCLRLEEARPVPDAGLVDALRTAIERHQTFLAKRENFEPNSNHGMWQSMALFETTRVLPDPALTRLALDRLLQLVTTSVSKGGVHKEHSTSYHFHFLQWLSEYVEYLGALNGLGWDGMDALDSMERNMQRCSPFLYDHRLNIPQIGDTDSQQLGEDLVSRWPLQVDEVLFDKESGYAIYKDLPASRWKRYVVFSIQNREYEPQLPHHWHNDMLAVYFSHDGEVILGDQGRYSYVREPIRGYLMSAAAHNTIVPVSVIVPQQPGIYLAENVSLLREKKRVTFEARLKNDWITRTVVVPADKPSIRVDDVIAVRDRFLLLWHIGADVVEVEATRSKNKRNRRYYEWRLSTRRGQRFTIQIQVEGENLHLGDEAAVVEGEKNPLLGWYSPAYKVFEPSPVIKLYLVPKDRIRVTTTVHKDG